MMSENVTDWINAVIIIPQSNISLIIAGESLFVLFFIHRKKQKNMNRSPRFCLSSFMEGHEKGSDIADII